MNSVYVHTKSTSRKTYFVFSLDKMEEYKGLGDKLGTKGAARFACSCIYPVSEIKLIM